MSEVSKGKKIIAERDGLCVVVDADRPGTLPYVCKRTLLDEAKICKEDTSFCDEAELDAWQIEVRDKRYAMIKGIIEQGPWEGGRQYSAEIRRCAQENGVSKQTIRSYIWSYYVHGGINGLVPLIRGRKTRRENLTEAQKNMRWALNTYYYSADKNPLTYAYQQMLLNCYTRDDGTLMPNYPTMRQFRYFYRQNHNQINEIISRHGLSYYQRNARPLTGSVKEYTENNIGVFMTDATTADIYLVNRLTREVLARPNIYVMVDAYTHLVTGIHVGYETGVDALRLLMINTCRDKAEYCRELGVECESWEWPSHHLPKKIITDRGREFTSGVMQSLCDAFGVAIESLPAYRPELKGPVEKFFDVLQETIKPMLKGRGVIMPDFAERGAPDYRLTASLDLKEFTRVVIKTVVFFNAHKLRENFQRTQDMIAADVAPVPAVLWKWLEENTETELKEVEWEAFLLSMLPKKKAKLTRRGIVCSSARYTNDKLKERFVRAGLKGAEEVTVAYVPGDMDRAWLLENGEYTPLTLTSREYSHMSSYEVESYLSMERVSHQDLRQHTLEKKLELIESVHAISELAAARSTPADKTASKASRAKAGKTPDGIDAKTRERSSVMELLRSEIMTDNED